MTQLELIQFFVKRLNLRLTQKRKVRKTGYVKIFKRKSGFHQKAISEKMVRVEVSSPVVNEYFGAYISEDSARKLHTQLSAHNAKVILDRVSFLPKSKFYNMIEENWVGFPVLIFLGNSKYPFVVQKVEIVTVGVKRNLSNCFLQSLDNIAYLDAISLKKKLQGSIPALAVPFVPKKPRKVKPKRRTRRKTWTKYGYEL
jgi:hypothetical protein